MTERDAEVINCGFYLRVHMDVGWTEIHCDPEKGCLRERVWSGTGKDMVVAEELGIPTTEVIGVYIYGDCADQLLCKKSL